MRRAKGLLRRLAGKKGGEVFERYLHVSDVVQDRYISDLYDKSRIVCACDTISSISFRDSTAFR